MKYIYFIYRDINRVYSSSRYRENTSLQNEIRSFQLCVNNGTTH